MARRTINFTYHGQEYHLGFTLNTVEQMERGGFVLRELADKTVPNAKDLFVGSFLAEHRGIKHKLVDEIFNELKDKEALITGLAEIYNEARESLLEEGNVSWTMSE